jgi:nucleotide-binding universal stress UspA family protein
MRILVWLVEGTWQGCVDAAIQIAPHDARFSLLYVTPSDVTDAAEAGAAGLFGRGFPGRNISRRFEDVANEEATQLLAAAASRLARADSELLHRQGRVEREVVSAAADGADLLVAARDGDDSRLGPKSLGKTTRFVVDHAPCAVLLVWPGETPGIGSIPPHPMHPPHLKHPPHPAR